MRQPPDFTSLPNDDFDLWFSLKAAAVDSKWRVVERLLDDSGHQQVPRHQLTFAAFGRAVLEGQPDIVARFLARGYVPELDDLETIFAAVEQEGVRPENAANAARAVKAVVAATDFDRAAFVRLLLKADSVADVLPLARVAGIDIFQDGDSLRYVLANGRTAGFRALCAQGVSVYAPSVVRHMRADTTEMRTTWQNLCTHDNRAGLEMLTRFNARNPDEPYRAALFLNPQYLDANGEPVTLLGVLVACGMVDRVFEVPERWAAHPAEAELVYKALLEYDAQEGQSLGPLTTHLRQQHLAEIAHRRPKFKL